MSYFFEKKNRIFEKNRDFGFPGMFHQKTIFLKIVQEHGAIISSVTAGLFRVHETERMAEMDSAF